MTVSLINRTGSDVTLYATSGEAGAFHVKDGETVEIPGEIANADTAEADGFYVIGEKPNERVWPVEVWELANGGEARGSRRRSNEPKNTEEN